MPADTLAIADVHLKLPARSANVAVVRHVVGAVAEVVGMPRGVGEDARLAVTEACTNVVRHAYGDRDGAMAISMRHDGALLRVEVADEGRGIAPDPVNSGAGLGLPLIAALADAVEIEHAPQAGSRIAMSFRRPEAAPEVGRLVLEPTGAGSP